MRIATGLAALTVSVTLSPPAAAQVGLSKSAAAATVVVGEPVDFFVTLRNRSATPIVGTFLYDDFEICFEPLGADASPCGANVACFGPACPSLACEYWAGGYGYRITGVDLAADDGALGGPDEILVAMTAIGASPSPACVNTAYADDSGTPLEATAAVQVLPASAPALRLTKTARIPAVPPGGTAPFDIALENIGTADLIGGRVVDVLEPCFEPLGIDLAPCGANVVCAGAACAAATCVYSNGGYGFDYTGFDLSPTDFVEILVTATAGSTPGPCANSCDGSGGGASPVSASDVVDVGGVGPCNLMQGDVTFAPVTPTRRPPWVYDSPCDRLAVINTSLPALGVDLSDDWLAVAGELRLYQIDCSCADQIRLTKSASGKIRVD